MADETREQGGVVEIDATTMGDDAVAQRMFELGMSDTPFTIKGEPKPPEEKAAKTTTKDQASAEGQEQEESAGGAAEEGDAADPLEADAEQEEEELHPLLASAKGKTTKAATLEPPKEVVDWFEKNKLGDVRAILKEYPAMRAGMTKVNDELTAAKRDLEFVAKLSPEARNVVDMDLAGKDWKKDVISRPSLDYRLTWEKQDKQKLAEQYAKGEITEEQRDEAGMEDADPIVKRLVESVDKRVRMLYERDRDEVVNYQQRTREAHEAEQKAFTQSRDKSLQYVYDTVPGAQAYKDEIEQAIDEIAGQFYEKDGTLRTDAALNAWFIKNKQMFMEAREGAIRREAKDEAQTDLLRRSRDKRPTPKRTATGSDNKTPEQSAKELFNQGWLGL